MITNSLKKLIVSLDKAKYRKSEGLFKAEGTKCVLDTIDHFETDTVIATKAWLEEHSAALPKECRCITVNGGEMGEIANMSSRCEVIALYKLPAYSFDIKTAEENLVLALDTVQDPGNLGTIVRLADWFGVRDIICSIETVDIFNPKAVMASMGAISRVRVHYLDLAATLKSMSGVPVYGTFLGGDNLFRTSLSSNGVIILGNEGNGISDPISQHVTHRITIPSYPADAPTSESLNVAMAAAITLAQFRNHG